MLGANPTLQCLHAYSALSTAGAKWQRSRELFCKGLRTPTSPSVWPIAKRSRNPSGGAGDNVVISTCLTCRWKRSRCLYVQCTMSARSSKRCCLCSSTRCDFPTKPLSGRWRVCFMSTPTIRRRQNAKMRRHWRWVRVRSKRLSPAPPCVGEADAKQAQTLFEEALAINPTDGRSWAGIGLSSQ